jgi:hypothetical protein
MIPPYAMQFTWTISSSHLTFLDIKIHVDMLCFHTSYCTHQPPAVHSHLQLPPLFYQMLQALHGRHIFNNSSDLSIFTLTSLLLLPSQLGTTANPPLKEMYQILPSKTSTCTSQLLFSPF